MNGSDGNDLSAYGRFVQKYGCPGCWLAAALMVFAVMYFFENSFYTVMTSYDHAAAYLWKPDHARYVSIVRRLGTAFVFTCLFSRMSGRPGQEKIDPLKTGVTLGFAIGLMIGLFQFDYYGVLPMPVFQISMVWFAGQVILGILMGVTLGLCRHVGNRISKMNRHSAPGRAH